MSQPGCEPFSPLRRAPDGHLWAGVVDPPVHPPDPFAASTIRATGADRVAFDIAECTGELRPRQLLEALAAEVMREGDALGYAPVDTPLPLFREAVQGYLARRGVPTTQSVTLFTSGTAGSLAVLARALVPEGEVVVVEHPTWHVALAVLASAGLRVVAIPLDDDGIRVDLLTAALQRHGVRMIYLQPAFHNPTGVSLSAERRAAVVEVARRFRAVVVEDDFAAELAHEGVPPALRAGEDAAETVVYLKSFSKIAAPALRAGVLVAAGQHERALRQAQHGLDPFPSAFAQAVLARFLPMAEFVHHTERVAALLAGRWEVLDGALHTRMPEGVRWTSPHGGLCAWLELPPPLNALDILADVGEAGVGFSLGSTFCLDNSGIRSARIAFGATPPSDIERGIRRLAGAVRERLRDPTRSPHAAVIPAP